MTKEIIFNLCPGEGRVAVLEDGRLVELIIDRGGEYRQVGNIYRGKVENVLPGMQAAFIDIGMEKNAFLYIDDLQLKPHGEGGEGKADASIKDLLKEGQDIIVQVIKESIGNKGARVVTHLTLAGRYLVLMPTVDYVGISRRIEDEKERERLKALAMEVRPAGMGLIVRTAAEGITAEEFRTDVEMLLNLWRKIQKKAKKGPVPSLLYRDHDILYRVLRDQFTAEIDRVVVDEAAAFERARELIKSFAPACKDRIHLHTGSTPVFDVYGIESQINEALRRRVWLENGSYIVFDQTEALTVIDVNTGKFTGTTNLNETVVLTNKIAAREIARQIRLRNLAGIIIIDFIDMENEGDRQEVLKVFETELAKDKVKANVLGFTSLGLLEVTRKKVRPSLQEQLQQVCPECEGMGLVVSPETMALRLERRIVAMAANSSATALLLGINPQMASILIGPGGSHLQTLEEATGKTLYLKGQEGLGLEDVRLMAQGTPGDLERLALPVVEGDICEVMVTDVHMNNPADGIGRIEGYVVDIEGAGRQVGQQVRVQITKAFRTYARGKLLESKDGVSVPG